MNSSQQSKQGNYRQKHSEEGDLRRFDGSAGNCTGIRLLALVGSIGIREEIDTAGLLQDGHCLFDGSKAFTY